jgi:hypothetical protein
LNIVKEPRPIKIPHIIVHGWDQVRVADFDTNVRSNEIVTDGDWATMPNFNFRDFGTGELGMSRREQEE